jgi:hypothetical protein
MRKIQREISPAPWHRACLPVMVVTFWASSAAAGVVVVQPEVFTVGPMADDVCDYHDIQSAINNAASGDVVRVTSGTWAVASSLEIYNMSLSLVGGYSNCSDTTSDPATPTIANHTAVDGTVLIIANGFAGIESVLVRNFNLTNGDGGLIDGGGLDVSGELEVRLDNVDIYGNEADYGGGIRVHGTFAPTLVLEGGSVIGGTGAFTGDNSATFNGGGIYCSEGGFIEWVDASINYNNALHGGGMYLDDCTLTMPNAAGSTLRTVEIRGNQALQMGGGLRVVNGASASLESALNRQVRISNNEAQNGGGVSVDDAQFAGAGVHIEENEASSLGGGVHLDTDASLDLSRGNPTGANCPNRPRCATLTRNQGGSGGGGAYVFDGSVLDLRQVFVERNSAPSSAAVGVSFATLVMRDVQVASNIATASPAGNVMLAGGSTLDLRHITLALNTADEALRLTNNASALVSDSILWQPGDTLVSNDGSGSLNGSCNNGSENTTLTGAVTHPPGFITEGVPLSPPPVLFLDSESQNIDACDDAPAPNPAFDLAGQMRITDLGDATNLAGPLDRGALEHFPPLFADGFEE